MSSKSSSVPVQPYGSAKDLPDYQEMAKLLQGGKLLTRFIARSQRKNLLKIERDAKNLTEIVDDFYKLLGPRNWIFHDRLNVSKIETLLSDNPDVETAESRLIELYRDDEVMRFWVMGLRRHEGLRARSRQIERAKAHYDADQFDSCVLQLVAVMDGFVNDFEPAVRKGLTSRNPDDMTAWNSVVGHHMGLTHAMNTFLKTIKKRVDEEVFDVYRHGIMHGSIVNFDNVIVATKAWNMLFAVADWATASRKASEPVKPEPTWRETWSALTRHANYKKYVKDFVASEIVATHPGFEDDELVVRAREFLDAWEHGRWALVAPFAPPQLLDSKSEGAAARFAKDTFERNDLTAWDITAVSRDQASSAEIRATVTVNGTTSDLRFRMVLWTTDGNVGMPGEAASWRLGVWAPQTFFDRRSGKSDDAD